MSINLISHQSFHGLHWFLFRRYPGHPAVTLSGPGCNSCQASCSPPINSCLNSSSSHLIAMASSAPIKLSDLHDCCHAMACYTRQLFCDMVRHSLGIETPHCQIPGSLSLDMITDAEHIATIATTAFRNQSQFLPDSNVTRELIIQREFLGMYQITFPDCLPVGLRPNQLLRKLSSPLSPLGQPSRALQHMWIPLPQ